MRRFLHNSTLIYDPFNPYFLHQSQQKKYKFHFFPTQFMLTLLSLTSQSIPNSLPIFYPPPSFNVCFSQTLNFFSLNNNAGLTLLPPSPTELKLTTGKVRVNLTRKLIASHKTRKTLFDLLTCPRLARHQCS